jgi:hypothetical protein
MLQRPQKLSILVALLAYAQAAMMSLCFVICLDGDGCAELESLAGHCCTAGVPDPHDHDDDGCLVASRSGAHGCDHPCAGCVDVPLLGQPSRVTPPNQPPAPAVLAAPDQDDALVASAWSSTPREKPPRPPGLAQFDRVRLTC